jgi:hypothetical protein
MDLADPVAVALAVAEALREEGVPHALYGALLLAAYGEARETRDVDVAVAHADAAAVAALLDTRLDLRTVPAFDRRPFGGLLLSRITLVEGEDLNTLDLVEPRDPDYAARALARSVATALRDTRIDVLAPEDFVLFKLLSTRDRDLADAASVLTSLPAELDRDLVEREIREIDTADPRHDLEARWRATLARVGGP